MHTCMQTKHNAICSLARGSTRNLAAYVWALRG